jgi:hypothetical protein
MHRPLTDGELVRFVQSMRFRVAGGFQVRSGATGRVTWADDDVVAVQLLDGDGSGITVRCSPDLVARVTAPTG